MNFYKKEKKKETKVFKRKYHKLCNIVLTYDHLPLR